MDKIKQLLIKFIGWGASSILITVVLIFQLFIKTEVPSYVKIGVPALMAGLIIFFVLYKYLKEFINRKLTAAETAKTLGHTVSPIYSVLSDCLIVVPLALVATLFLIIGPWARTVGLILLECSGLLQFGFVSNVITQIGKNNLINQSELEKMQANNIAIAKEVKKIIAINEVEVSHE